MIKKNILLICALLLNFNYNPAFEANCTQICPIVNSPNSSAISNELLQHLAYTSTYSVINTNLNKIFLKDKSAAQLLKKIPLSIIIYLILNLGFNDASFDANLLLFSLGIATFDNLLCQRYVDGSFVQKVENKLKSALGITKNAAVKYQDGQIANLCFDLSSSSAWLLSKKAMGF
jgi:hypothetical protein